MKIVHICLAAVYVEGMGYQENILPQFHVEMGNDVTVITSRRIFNSRYEAMERQETRYTNPYGVKVITLEASTRYGFYSKYGDFDGLYDTLLDLQPDIVFVHGAQFVGLMDVIKYCKTITRLSTRSKGRSRRNGCSVIGYAKRYRSPRNSGELRPGDASI